MAVVVFCDAVSATFKKQVVHSINNGCMNAAASATCSLCHWRFFSPVCLWVFVLSGYARPYVAVPPPGYHSFHSIN